MATRANRENEPGQQQPYRNPTEQRLSKTLKRSIIPEQVGANLIDNAEAKHHAKGEPQGVCDRILLVGNRSHLDHREQNHELHDLGRYIAREDWEVAIELPAKERNQHD